MTTFRYITASYHGDLARAFGLLKWKSLDVWPAPSVAQKMKPFAIIRQSGAGKMAMEYVKSWDMHECRAHQKNKTSEL